MLRNSTRSPSTVPLPIPTTMSDSSCQTEKKFVPKNSTKAPSASHLPSIVASPAPADSCSQENEVSEIYFLDEKHHMSQPSVGQCREAIQYKICWLEFQLEVPF